MRRYKHKIICANCKRWVLAFYYDGYMDISIKCPKCNSVTFCFSAGKTYSEEAINVILEIDSTNKLEQIEFAQVENSEEVLI
jgi:phage FluMu protein Com